MKLQRYYDLTPNTVDGFGDLRQEMTRLFDHAFPNLSRLAGFQGDALPVDLYRDENHYYVRAELPGVSKEDIKVEYADGWLKLSASYRQEATEATPGNEGEALQAEGKPQRLETATFQRQVRVPKNVDAARIDAKYENGVLTLTLPLKEEAKPRAIEINID